MMYVEGYNAGQPPAKLPQGDYAQYSTYWRTSVAWLPGPIPRAAKSYLQFSSHSTTQIAL